ncbi:MAG: YwiC-like family protein [Anaerolineales bacterium]|nr:YwiC-like family protein [Anaerolineales bacterium]
MASEQKLRQEQIGIWRRMWRKQLILPAEHGSWSWLLVPFAVGVVIAGQMPSAVWLTFVGGFAVFLMRQPATVLFRVRRGRARKSDGSPAVAWLILLGSVAVGALLGLLSLGRGALLWLVIPLTAVLAFYLLGSRQGRAGLRTLWMELAGAVALAGMAPAALVAATGSLSLQVWMLWLLMGLQNGLGALYVRLRIADTHQRPFRRQTIIWWHVGGLLILIIVALLGMVPPGVIVPYVGLLLRAVWIAQQARPVADVKQFGFVEVGVEVISGLWIVAAYWRW